MDSNLIHWPGSESPPLEDGLDGVTRPTEGAEYPSAKRIAREAYLRARRLQTSGSHTSVGSDHDPVVAAVEACVTALSQNRHLFPPTAPPASFELLMGWVQNGMWEQSYRRELAAQTLAQDPLARLSTLKASLEEASTIADQLRQSCLQLPGGNPPTEAQVRKYQLAWKTYLSVAQELRTEEDALRRTLIERSPDDSATDESATSQIYNDLIEQYGDLGAPYRILCQTLAQNIHRLSSLNSSSRDVPVDEYVKITELNTRLIAQLQKYTEATKSQTVSHDIQTLAEELMNIINNVIGPTQPRLFADIVRAVRTHTAVKAAPQPPVPTRQQPTG